MGKGSSFKTRLSNSKTSYPKSLKYTLGGKVYTINAGFKLTDIETIAGKGSKTTYRKAKFTAHNYGSKAKDWSKKKGFTAANEHILEVHWLQHKDIGKKSAKVKYPKKDKYK